MCRCKDVDTYLSNEDRHSWLANRTCRTTMESASKGPKTRDAPILFQLRCPYGYMFRTISESYCDVVKILHWILFNVRLGRIGNVIIWYGTYLST